MPSVATVSTIAPLAQNTLTPMATISSTATTDAVQSYSFVQTQKATTIRHRTLNILTGAVAMDKQLRTTLLSCPSSDRMAAIARHNREYAIHFGQHLIELNEEELGLFLTVQFTTLQEFYSVFAEVYETIPVVNNYTNRWNGSSTSNERIYLSEDNPAA